MEETTQAVQPAAVAKPRRERGTGRVWQMGLPPPSQSKRARVWWIQFYDSSGRQRRESSHSDKKMVAERLLRRRLGEKEAGLLPSPRAAKVLVEDLVSAYLLDYRTHLAQAKPGDIDEEYLQERAGKLADWTARRWTKHLKPYFGHMRAIAVSTENLNRYIEHRKAEGADSATINRELALLRRAFNLAKQQTPPKVSQAPMFPKRLPENSPRGGFVDDAQYTRLCEHCKEPWLRALLAVAYAFGFRKAELLNMRMRQVDLLERTIRLNPGTTKNKEGRTVKMTEEVYRLLAAGARGKGLDDYVFTRSADKRVRDFRGAWSKLTQAAGLPGLLLHDFRRSAVRNMVRRGVPEVVAMRISGHKTRAVFDRYNIVSESDLADAARRIEQGRNGANSGQIAEIDEAAKSAQHLYNQ